MKKIVLLAACGLIGTVTLLAGAQISGKVTLKGTPPAERTIAFDPLCGKLHSEKVTTHHYKVAKDGGFGDVFVYIKEKPAGTYAPPAKAALLDQKGCTYHPYVSGLMVNQKLKIRNDDPLMHNVHATPKVAGNKEFNVGQPVKGMEYTTSFPKSEVLLRFKCDVHPWMFAYIGVLDHPFFAVTDKDGNFKLPAGLPAGEYTLVAYHRKAGKVTQKITVADGDQKVVNFTMQVPVKK